MCFFVTNVRRLITVEIPEKFHSFRLVGTYFRDQILRRETTGLGICQVQKVKIVFSLDGMHSSAVLSLFCLFLL